MPYPAAGTRPGPGVYPGLDVNSTAGSASIGSGTGPHASIGNGMPTLTGVS